MAGGHLDEPRERSEPPWAHLTIHAPEHVRRLPRLGSRRLLNLSIGIIHFCLSARRSAPSIGKFPIQSALIGVFFAVDRRNVRWIFIEIGSPYPIFLAVRVDPLPQGSA